MTKGEKLGTHHKGSLLLESLLAVTILSVSLTLIIQSLVSSSRGIAYNTKYMIAMLLLDDKMNELMAKRATDESLETEGNFPKPFEHYQYHLETKTMEEIKGLSEVTLSVSWTSGHKENGISEGTYWFKLPK